MSDGKAPKPQWNPSIAPATFSPTFRPQNRTITRSVEPSSPRTPLSRLPQQQKLSLSTSPNPVETGSASERSSTTVTRDNASSPPSTMLGFSFTPIMSSQSWFPYLTPSAYCPRPLSSSPPENPVSSPVATTLTQESYRSLTSTPDPHHVATSSLKSSTSSVGKGKCMLNPGWSGASPHPPVSPVHPTWSAFESTDRGKGRGKHSLLRLRQPMSFLASSPNSEHSLPSSGDEDEVEHGSQDTTSSLPQDTTFSQPQAHPQVTPPPFPAFSSRSFTAMRPHLMTMTRLEDYANHLNCMAKMITEQTLPQLFRDHSLAMNDLQHDISGMASRDQARLSERLSGLRAKFSDIPEAVESTPQDPHPNKVESEEEKRTGQEHQHKYKDEEYFANLEVSQLSEFTSQGLDIDARVSTTTNPLRKKARLDQDDSGVRSQQDDYGGTEQSQADQHFELSDYLITQEIWTSSCIAGSHQQAMGPCSAAVSMETDNVNVRKHKRSDESDLTSSSPLKSQNYLSGNVTSQSATQQTNTIDPNNLQRATSAYQSTSSISENQASHSKAAKTAKSAFKEQTMVQQHEQDTPETKESFTRGVMISNWNIVLSDHIHCLLECSNYARMYVQLDTPRVFMGMEQTANTLPSSQGSVLSSYERPHAQGTLSNTPTGPSQAQQRAQQLRSKVAAEVALLAKGANEIFSAITKYHAVRSGLLLKIERERAAMNNRGQHSGYVRALEQQVEFLDYRHAHRLWLWGLDMQSSCVVLYRVLRTMLPRLGSRSRV